MSKNSGMRLALVCLVAASVGLSMTIISMSISKVLLGFTLLAVVLRCNRTAGGAALQYMCTLAASDRRGLLPPWIVRLVRSASTKISACCCAFIIDSDVAEKLSMMVPMQAVDRVQKNRAAEPPFTMLTSVMFSVYRRV